MEGWWYQYLHVHGRLVDGFSFVGMEVVSSIESNGVYVMLISSIKCLVPSDLQSPLVDLGNVSCFVLPSRSRKDREDCSLCS